MAYSGAALPYTAAAVRSTYQPAVGHLAAVITSMNVRIKKTFLTMFVALALLFEKRKQLALLQR